MNGIPMARTTRPVERTVCRHRSRVRQSAWWAVAFLLAGTSCVNAATMSLQAASGGAGTTVLVPVTLSLASGEQANQLLLLVQVWPDNASVPPLAANLTYANLIPPSAGATPPVVTNSYLGPTGVAYPVPVDTPANTSVLNVNWNPNTSKFNTLTGPTSVTAGNILIPIPASAPSGSTYTVRLLPYNATAKCGTAGKLTTVGPLTTTLGAPITVSVPSPHTLSVTATATPATVSSGGSTSLTATATDSLGHGIATWSWSDGGAGGSFAPSPAAQNPTYTAAANTTDNNRSVTLTVTATCNGPIPISNSGSTVLTVQPVPHTLSVTAAASPSTVASGGTTSLTGSATDSHNHGIATWSWSDGGAGGSFAPSAAVQNPTYTAAANTTDNNRSVTLTVTATCNGPNPISNSGSATVTVQPVPHTVSVSASASPTTVVSGGSTSLTATAVDSHNHGISSWSWSDGGAGGTFSPSAAVQNPTYTAPANTTGSARAITLTATATCNGPTPVSGSGATIVTVLPRFDLTVSGVGEGAVSVNGVLHPLPWTGQFDAGQTITLDAKPALGWVFGGWSGDAGGSATPAVVVMSATKNVTATFLRITQNVMTWDMSSNPGWTLEGDWAWGQPTGQGGDSTGRGKDPTSAQVPPGSNGNVLGTNLQGNYSPSVDESATSNNIDCTGKVQCQLTFTQWLNVEAYGSDEATVEVSNGGDWVVVWQNSPDQDTIMTGFQTVTVDISQVTDNQSAVRIRFRLVSNGSIEYGGWNLSSVKLTSAGNGTRFSFPLNDANEVSGWTFEDAGPGFPPGTPGWQIGAPIAGGGEVLADGTTGADPAAAHTGGLVVGYVIGGNYQRNMAPRYLTTPAFAFSNSRDVTLDFWRWLAVEDAAFDKAAIQINTDDLDAQELFSDDFTGDLSNYSISGTGSAGIANGVLTIKGPLSVAAPIDTTERYDLTGSVDLGTDLGSAGTNHVLIQWTDGLVGSSGSVSWNDVVPPIDVTGTTGVTTYTFSIPRQSLGTDPEGEDNPKFQLRVAVQGGTATVDNLSLSGVTWKYLFQNPLGVNTFDSAWTEVTIPIADEADGKEKVRVRWVMGPTDDFTPGPGQSATEYGGWSLDDINFTEGTIAWRAESYQFPAAMQWDQSGAAAVTIKNMGTGYLDTDFYLGEVAGPASSAEVGTTPGESSPIDRYGAGSVYLAENVDSSQTADFSIVWTAPPLTTMAYRAPVGLTAVADAELSVTGANWFLFDPAGNPVPLYDDLTADMPDMPKSEAGVVISRFPDIGPDTDGYWARFWIEELAGRVPLVVQGYPEPEGPPTYRPLAVLSRDQMAVYISRAMGLSLSPATGVFRDVPTDYWAAEEIEAVARAGVVQGYPPDFTTYQPNNPVTRDQMAKFVCNGMHLAHPVPAVGNDPFTDVPVQIQDPSGALVTNPFVEFIAALKQANVVQGYSDGTYRPQDTVTRDQLAVYIWRAFICPTGAPVVLAGPSITPVDLGAADWIGWPTISEDNAWTASNTVYVSLDAMRLADTMVYTPSGTWSVKFELRDIGAPDVPAPAARTWTANVTGTDIDNARGRTALTGDPYFTLFQLLPTVSPDTFTHADMVGDFMLVASVRDNAGAWDEVSRQAEYKSYGRLLYNNFETGIPTDDSGLTGWKLGGLPGSGPLWHSGQPSLDDSNAESDVAHCVQFTQSQFMARHISSVGWQGLVLTCYMGGSNIGSSESFVLEYSADGGVNWTAINTLSNVPTAEQMKDVAMTKVTFGFPSAADQNPNLWLRVRMAAVSTDALGWIDNIQIKGL